MNNTTLTPKTLPAEQNSGCINDTERALLGKHDHPEHPGSNDWRIEIIPHPVIGLIATTNGDPIQQEGNEEMWERLMAEYKLTPNSAGETLLVNPTVRQFHRGSSAKSIITAAFEMFKGHAGDAKSYRSAVVKHLLGCAARCRMALGQPQKAAALEQFAKSVGARAK